jgi:hypothetical protein
MADQRPDVECLQVKYALVFKSYYVFDALVNKAGVKFLYM